MDGTTKPTSKVPALAWWILILSSFDSVLSLIDRQAVAILKVELKAAFAITDSGYGQLAAVFLLAYGAFNIPAGWLVDRIGSRIALSAFVIIWSAATFATGLAGSFEALLFWRFVLGAAEAGLVPATMFALLRWFPPERLATTYSLRGPITSLGPILAPPVVAGLTIAFGWREAFFVLGAVGVVFGLAWWFSDTRGTKPAIRPTGSFTTPFRAIFANPLFLGLFAARLVADPLWFFIQFWQAGYFQEVLGLKLSQIGALLWIPPLVSTLLAVAIGAFADRQMRRGRSGWDSRVRALVLVTCAAPATAMIPYAGTVPNALALFALAQLVCWSWIVLTSVMAATIAPAGTSATAIATLNTPGIALGALFNAVAGSLIEGVGYQAVFLLLAFCHPLAAVLLVGVTRRAQRRATASS